MASGGLTQVDDNDSREARIGRILDDLQGRRARGEFVDEARVLAEHADLADELREHLGLLRELRPRRSSVADLIAQGILSPPGDGRYAAEMGAYKIFDFLGRGGMGIVLKAYEESLNRMVALKILRPELADDVVALGRFEREAKTAAGLRHPNIVTVYAVGRERGMPFLAMEYVNGPSLAAVLGERGPLSAETTRLLFGQLLSALDAAHHAGLIHRDIKSANILLDVAPGRREQVAGGGRAEGCCARALDDADQSAACDPDAAVAKLADFGLARMVTAQTRVTLPAAVLGTPEYMSPEQARGEEDIDQRSDLYSAGVVLYEMLTGRTPFRADTPSATIHRILNEEPQHPRVFAKEADAVLASLALRLMAKRREDRFGTAGEARGAMEEAGRIRLPERRRRTLRRAAALVLVLVIGLAGWGMVRRTAQQGPPTLAGSTMQGDDEILEVKIEDGYKHVLGRGKSAEWKVLRWVLPDYQGDFQAADVANRDDPTSRLVVVGLREPDGGGEYVLFAFGSDQKERWRISLSPSPLRRWPDCGGALPWQCHRIVASNLDSEAGDEVVVIARDGPEYPSRVSVIEAQSGVIRSTFWHMGHLDDLRVVPDFFDEGRPALLVVGINNKLDGFDEPDGSNESRRGRDGPVADDDAVTQWDYVSVVMILDPDPGKMNGLGPPRTRRMDWLAGADFAAKPYAYAFLDAPHDKLCGPRIPDSHGRAVKDEKDAYMVTGAESRVLSDMENGVTSFVLSFHHPQGTRLQDIGGAICNLDRHLQLPAEGGVVVCQGEDKLESFWREHWKVIIRDGEYVGLSGETAKP